MHTRTILPLAGVIIGIGLLALYLKDSATRGTAVPTALGASNESSAPVIISAITTRAADAIGTAKTQLPSDPRPEVQQVYVVASVTKLYNFNPTVTHFAYKTNRNGKVSAMLQTPTHFANIIGGRLEKLVSLVDSAGAPHDTNNSAIKEWYTCTGTWSEKDAVAETFAILERLNDTNTLQALKGGIHEYEAVPVTVPAPTGGSVRVAPFHVVRLFRPGESVPQVRVEFRMGPNGPAGVTEFSRWP